MYDSIIILGPTATGKTKISIELAKRFNTEIVNADSMYIYKKLDIGTAKPTIEEMSGVIHHLISIVSPIDTFNVSQYRLMASVVIKNMINENKLPIIVGGTGFYIDSLINNYSYASSSSIELRNDLEKQLSLYGKEFLYNKLKSMDPSTAQKLHINDTKRVIRALEINLSTGKNCSSINNNNDPILKNPLIIGLNIERAELYNRINYRVDLMMNSGLIDEVKKLYDSGLRPDINQAMKGIGYKEICAYFDGKYTLDKAVDLIKQHTRNYAKRQITWFKRNSNIIWLNPNCLTIIDDIINLFNKEKSTI